MLCRVEAPYQGKILKSTANTISNTNTDGDAQIIRVFSVSPARDPYEELLLYGLKPICDVFQILVVHLWGFLNIKLPGFWGPPPRCSDSVDLGSSLFLTSMPVTKGHIYPEGTLQDSGSLPRDPFPTLHYGPLQWGSECAAVWEEGPRSPCATKQGLGVSKLENPLGSFYATFFIQDQNKHFFWGFLKARFTV